MSIFVFVIRLNLIRRIVSLDKGYNHKSNQMFYFNYGEINLTDYEWVVLSASILGTKITLGNITNS